MLGTYPEAPPRFASPQDSRLAVTKDSIATDWPTGRFATTEEE